MSCQSPILNSQSLPSASAIILAGGKSSRMGQPKALLLFDDEPLIAHLVRIVRGAFSDVVVVAAPEQELPPVAATLVRDSVAYQGPVGGICYGLQAAREELCFVTSCDAPFLNLDLVRFLLSLAAEQDVVVPHWQERLQPLFAVYRRSVAPLLRQQLERGELRPIFLYDKVRTRKVPAAEMLPFDPEGLSFRNLNSPEEYQEALVLWHDRQRRETEIKTNQTATATEKRDHGLGRALASSASVANLALTVELFGVARLKAKAATASLVLPLGATLADAFVALAKTYPALIGTVLSADACTLLPGYACNLNGREFTKDSQTVLNNGDQLLILSSDAGG